MTPPSTTLRKTRAQHRAEQAAKTAPINNYLPALTQERQRMYAQRAERGLMARLVKRNADEGKNPNHYKTGDGETLQPTRPGSDQAAKLPSHGYSC